MTTKQTPQELRQAGYDDARKDARRDMWNPRNWNRKAYREGYQQGHHDHHSDDTQAAESAAMTTDSNGTLNYVPESLVKAYEDCYDGDEQVGWAAAYLAAVIDHAFNPPDGEEAQEALLTDAVLYAARFIEDTPCGCDPVDPAEHGPCRRCRALGRLADVRQDR